MHLSSWILIEEIIILQKLIIQELQIFLEKISLKEKNMIKDIQKYNEKVESNTSFLKELQEKLPEFFSNEKRDECGNVVEKSKFDLQKFQDELENKNIEELTNGYRLDFIGKNYARKQTGEAPTTLIVPDNTHNKKEVNKRSENLFFTGDNLEVLRHLQGNYSNSIDFIYIDPPYNTGSDGFLYPDNFEFSDEQLMNIFSLNDEEILRLKSIQGKSTHSSWLAFMYPRLYLAKKLLKKSGAIFISIDDNEQANLKLIMDELFGEGNFITNLIWKSKSGGASDSQFFAVDHEYIVVYSKNSQFFEMGLDKDAQATTIYNKEDKRGKYSLERLDKQSLGYQETLDFPIIGPDGKEYIVEHKNPNQKLARWRWGKKTVIEKYEELVFKNNKVYTKNYEKKGQTPRSLLIDERFGRTRTGKEELTNLMKLKDLFPNPKSTKLIKFLISVSAKKDAIILDFFAGSSTTAEAVMQLNAEDNGTRQFIMCTIPEKTYTTQNEIKIPTKGGRNAYDAGFEHIDEISRERIIRAADKINEKNPIIVEGEDIGFKHFRVIPATQDVLNKIDYDENMQLDMFDDMISIFSSEKLGISGDATGEDTILQTYLVKDGYKFNVLIEKIDIKNIQVWYVNKQRIYIISDEWNTEHTRILVNMIGENLLTVQTIVIYGYSISMESLREIEIALKQLESKVFLQVRY